MTEISLFHVGNIPQFLIKTIHRIYELLQLNWKTDECISQKTSNIERPCYYVLVYYYFLGFFAAVGMSI